MHARYVVSRLKQNSWFLVGLCVGLYVALVLVPVEPEPACEERVAAERTTDDYEPQMNSNIKQLPKTQVKNIQRPRYYSTELGIKDKLFVGVMSSEDNINHQATAINKTIAHLTSKIKFFITANVVKSNLNLSNVVGFTDTREMLKPFHVLKYIADNFLEEFDYFFIISDVGFVNGRKLLDVVNKISVSEDVYMGTIGDGDSHYCALDTGILLSNSVLKSVHSNLDWCVRNSYSPQHFENVGRCVLHSTSLKCKEEIQGQKLGSIHLTADWQPSPALADVVSAYPVDGPDHTYKLHAYVSRVYLERVSQEILSLRSFLVSNVNRHPVGFRNSSWPGGLRGDGTAPPTPETRFDHLRWTSFNETHALFADDHHAVTRLTGATKKSIDLVLEAAWNYAKATWEHLEPAGLVEGQWQWDPARSLNYLLLLRLIDRETQKHTLRRLEVCRPLGQTQILPVPYVTESARVSILLPVTPPPPADPADSVADTLAFLARFRAVCLKRADKTFLLLVLVYPADASSRGENDPYEKLKKEALSLSEEFKDTGGKVEWVSVRLPAEARTSERQLLRAAALEIGLTRFARDTLVLWPVPDCEFSEDFLNRVRMNTIAGRQVFSPVPFARFDQYLHERFVDADGGRPQTNTGRFDERNRDVLSFYKRDYDALRSGADALLPPLRGEADLPHFLREARARNLTRDLPLRVLLRSRELHVLRAPEPGLILRPRADPPCGGDAPCLRRLEADGFSTVNFGAKAQLAKLILETELEA